jgi:hypothetical protein
MVGVLAPALHRHLARCLGALDVEWFLRFSLDCLGISHGRNSYGASMTSVQHDHRRMLSVLVVATWPLESLPDLDPGIGNREAKTALRRVHFTAGL